MWRNLPTPCQNTETKTTRYNAAGHTDRKPEAQRFSLWVANIWKLARLPHTWAKFRKSPSLVALSTTFWRASVYHRSTGSSGVLYSVSSHLIAIHYTTNMPQFQTTKKSTFWPEQMRQISGYELEFRMPIFQRPLGRSRWFSVFAGNFGPPIHWWCQFWPEASSWQIGWLGLFGSNISGNWHRKCLKKSNLKMMQHFAQKQLF